MIFTCLSIRAQKSWLFFRMPPPTGKVTHVIFDYDGILIETESLYTKANTMVLARYGAEFTMDIKRSK